MHGVAPICLHRFRVAQDVLFLEHLQGGQRGGAGQRVAGIRIAVEQFDTWRRVHEGVVDVLFAEHGAHRHHAVGQALGRRHQVRFDVEIVGRERRRHAAETRDHFIEDEQDAVLGAQLAQAFQIAFRRDQHARGTGHRFDDDGGDRRGVVQRDDAFQFIGQVRAIFGLARRIGVLLQVMRVRQMVHAGQQGAEGLAVAADAAHGNAAEAHAVIAAFAADQARARALAARPVIRERDLQCRVHRFGTGIRIEHVAELVARVVHQFFRQVEGGRMAHLESGREVELAHHLADGADDLRLRMAAWHAPQAGRAIEDGIAIDVLVVHAFGRDQQARIGLEVAVVGKRHPECRHRFRPCFVHDLLLGMGWRGVRIVFDEA